jgi:hypothetical protein
MAAAQEEGVLLVGEALGPGVDLGFELEHLGDRHRQVAQLPEVFGFGLFAEAAIDCLARARVSSARAASWVVKALVEATPISGPARVRKRSAVSRTMADSGTLQMARVRPMPSALGKLEGGQGVGGFAGLGDDDDQGCSGSGTDSR